MEGKPVKVSIAIITYNHEAFIAAALDSVLSQQTTFNYEIVIGEDCSTDNTRRIVTEYQQRYPDKIRLLLAEHNLGATRNFAQTIQACRGEYIALLEGDDYWIDDQKMQTQADYLDGHPACTVCFQGSLIFSQASGRITARNAPQDAKATYTLTDFLRHPFIAVAATMVRNGVFGDFPGWYYQQEDGFADVLILLTAQHGDIGYLDRDTSVKREHPGGMWTGADHLQRCKWDVQRAELYDRHFNYKYSAVMHVTKVYWRAAVVCGTTNEPANARRFIAKALLAYPRDRSVSLIRLVGTWLQFWIPAVHRIALQLKTAVRPQQRPNREDVQPRRLLP